MSESTQQPPPQESPETSPESQPSPEAQEQQEAPQEAAPASPESPAESAEAEPAEASDAGDEAAPEQPQKRGRKSGYQRQIERLEREKAQLWEMLQRNQSQGQAPQPQKQLTPEEQVTQQFEALVDQRLNQRLVAERAAASVAAEAAELQKQMAEARTRYQDFDEVVGSTPMPPQHVQAAILKSKAKAEIMYALGSNPAELARLSALPQLDVALEIGRLEAKVASGAAQQKVSPAHRKPAPAPISPVTARGASNVKPADQMSYEEYKAWRAQAKR